MPGPQVKNWNQYHALRKEGYSKSAAAKIANAGSGSKSKTTKKGTSKKGRK